MPFNRLLEHEAFGPEDIKVLVKAFEDTLSALGVLHRDDPLTELIAKKIIECAPTGERDPIRLRDRALNSAFLITAAPLPGSEQRRSTANIAKLPELLRH